MTLDARAARAEVRFMPKPEDMIAAQRCFYVVRCLKPSAFAWYAAAFIVVAVFVFVEMPQAPWYWIGAVLAAALAGGTLTPMAILRWRVPRVARRIYHQQRNLHRDLTLAWDDDELRYTWAKGHSRSAFADYLRWAENRDIILLFHSDTLFQFIPKRVLDHAQIEDLRSIARQKKLIGARSRR